jgi:hypothetical protein
MSSFRLLILIIVFAILVIVGIWFSSPWLIPLLFPIQLAEKYDPFAILNSLFSGLAFAGVIGALLLQRRSLQMQRDDFTEQINLLKDQTKHAEQSNTNSLLVPLLMKYRSQQIHEAISALWGFKHTHKDKFLEVYEEQLNETSGIDFQHGFYLSSMAFWQDFMTRLRFLKKSFTHIGQRKI